MLSARSISSAISMTFSMAKGDPDWAEKHDMSAEAVFMSFWAVPLAILPHLVAAEGARRILLEQTVVQVAPAGAVANAVAQVITLLVSWGVELLLITNLAQRREIGWKISPLIIGYNWSIFISRMAQGLGIGLFLVAGMAGMAQFATLLVAFLSVWLRWGVLRRALGTTPMGTVGVIVLLLIVSMAAAVVLSLLFQAVGLMPSTPVPAAD
ncbi:hypothetical protein HK107_07310 [Parvularcula sp. ZS-1/3]|uniref:Yip1 domain-containing protein n=1 Tax=Parvularcula mediterranea TaxID=2732508 RepID=A0A7Y3RL79_9PROT|nr:hypothetical protein [Parvularcula mediterranea]NNU16128.1 hypothetical protein [Parvularcula mediterranea]